MLNFKKVVKSTSAKKNHNEKDQKNYMEKVKALSNSCIKFVKYLKNVDENTNFADIEKTFKTLFKAPMSKNKMLSRTSRVLHQMDKNLLKFKGKFNIEEVEEYSEIFRFKAEKANKNDYIKRSAIDDETIANTFCIEIPKILIEKKVKSKKEFVRSLGKKPLKELFNKETGIFTAKTEEDLKKAQDYKDNILDVFIGDKIEKISKGAFNGCKKLKHVNLGKNCEEIEDSAFLNCTALKVINLENITEIGECAFQGCKLIGINLKKVKTIERYAFKDCSSLSFVDLLENSKAEELKKIIQEQTENKEIKFNGTKEPVKKKTKEILAGVYNVKTEEDLKKIKNLKKEDIVNVNIGDGIQKISDELFAGFSKLQTVQLGKNCKKIGNSAFFNCTALKVINLENVTEIGDNAFSKCEALQNVDLGKVTKMHRYAFSGCESSLTEVKLKNTPNIEGCVFLNCKELQNVDLGEATSIGDYAFDGCKNLKKVISTSVKTIGNHAFDGCADLEDIDLSKVTTIGNYTFYKCVLLNKINLENVTSIDDNAFSGCSSLSEINLENVTKIEKSAFNSCGKLSRVVLGQSQVEIANDSFPDTKDLIIFVSDNTSALAEKINKQFKNIVVTVKNKVGLEEKLER